MTSRDRSRSRSSIQLGKQLTHGLGSGRGAEQLRVLQQQLGAKLSREESADQAQRPLSVEDGWWRVRVEMRNDDPELPKLTQEEKRDYRRRQEGAALREFIAGPTSEEQDETIDWFLVQRREEPIFEGERQVGKAIIYEAPVAPGFKA